MEGTYAAKHGYTCAGDGTAGWEPVALLHTTGCLYFVTYYQENGMQAAVPSLSVSSDMGPNASSVSVL